MSTPAPVPGRLSQTLIRMFMKHARVTEVATISAGLRLITLESPEFKGITWTPGQKVQVAMGSAFASRTFTPIEWDAQAGRTRLLGYVHGNGPGGTWANNVQPGDECDVFGPRTSLNVSHVNGLSVVLGDETSIGLIAALSRYSPGKPLKALLEVGAVAQTSQALTQLDLGSVELFERTEDDTHLTTIEHCLPAFVASGATFVLTGKAPTIQRLRRALKAQGVPASRLIAKAYWAPGKRGLD